MGSMEPIANPKQVRNLWRIYFLLERTKNEQIKWLISRRMQILSSTIQKVTNNLWTNFRNPWFNSSLEIFDTNSPYLTLKWKMEKKNHRKQKSQHLGLLLHNSSALSGYIQNLKTLASIEGEKFVTKILFEKKRNNERVMKLIISYHDLLINKKILEDDEKNMRFNSLSTCLFKTLQICVRSFSQLGPIDCSCSFRLCQYLLYWQ